MGLQKGIASYFFAFQGAKIKKNIEKSFEGGGGDPPGRYFTGGVGGPSPGLVKRGRSAPGAPWGRPGKSRIQSLFALLAPPGAPLFGCAHAGQT